MSEQTNRQTDIAGETDHHQHRAGPGEGVRAPFAAETGVAEISVFDGKGNESVVRLSTDADGNTAQGTGPTSADAAADAEKLLKEGRGRTVGEAFGSVHHEKS